MSTLTQLGFTYGEEKTDIDSSEDEDESKKDHSKNVVSPPSKKRKTNNDSDDSLRLKRTKNRNDDEENYQLTKPLRVSVGVREDIANEDMVHPVYGYTKHWFDKEYIELKRHQILEKLKWWRTHHMTIMEKEEDMYDQTVLDAFWDEAINESCKIDEHIKVYNHVVLNVLNQEALASVIGKNANDGIVSFFYHLIHSTQITVNRADWFIGFESVTEFVNDGVLVGEIILEAGKKLKWRPMNIVLDED